MKSRPTFVPTADTAARGLSLAPELESALLVAPQPADTSFPPGNTPPTPPTVDDNDQTDLNDFHVERSWLSAAARVRLSSCSTSAAVHAGLLLILALMTTSTRGRSIVAPLQSSIATNEEAGDDEPLVEQAGASGALKAMHRQLSAKRTVARQEFLKANASWCPSFRTRSRARER